MKTKYDNDGLLITDKHVFFFRNICPFSNFYLSDFYYGAIKMKFFCSEQFFMYFKASTFDDDDIAIDILNAKTPKDCKDLGRKVKNYDDRLWNVIRYDVMLEANMMKFSQSLRLYRFLVDKRFDGKTFVEASPYDKIWGIGKSIDADDIDDESKWNGTNLQGKVIGEVRKTLIQQYGQW